MNVQHEQIALHNEARRVVAQSYIIHPEWDEDDHLDYLDAECGIERTDLATVVAWPTGPSTATIERFVGMWLRNPQRCFEGAR